MLVGGFDVVPVVDCVVKEADCVVELVDCLKADYVVELVD